jgi:hypothetical protein
MMQYQNDITSVPSGSGLPGTEFDFACFIEDNVCGAINPVSLPGIYVLCDISLVKEVKVFSFYCIILHCQEHGFGVSYTSLLYEV